MSDKHTAYRGDSYHTPRDGDAPYNQQQYHADPHAGQMDPAHGVDGHGMQTGAYGQQNEQYYAAPETAQGQGVDYSGIYGDAGGQHQDHQGYVQDPALGGHNQYAQGYDAHQAGQYGQHGGYEEEVDPYLAAHQNATPPFDASQHAANSQYQTQDQYSGYQDPADQSYYSQAHMDAGQTQFVDQTQMPSDQMPAVYGQGQQGYDPQYAQGVLPPADPYGQDPNYGAGVDYAAYGAQGMQPVPQGMPHVNDPYAQHGHHQPMAAPMDDDFQASGRKSFLVGTMILGSVIIGGGVAFAYKYAGDNGNQNAPMIISDAGDAKVVPDDPGGRELANQNKKIFARLGDPKLRDEAAKVETLRGQIEDTANEKVGAVKKVADETAGGPHKVKTIRIDRNGNRIIGDEVAAVRTNVGAVKDIPGVNVDTGKPARAVKIMRETAALKEKPVLKQQEAKVERNVIAAPPATDGNYVVQISARRTQQDALAAFSGMQAKYGTVLNGYRPLIQRADLGAKGVWYRLRVGPMGSKDLAGNVCTQLKAKGLSSCFVTAR